MPGGRQLPAGMEPQQYSAGVLWGKGQTLPDIQRGGLVAETNNEKVHPAGLRLNKIYGILCNCF